MTLKPCLTCGEPTPRSHCAEHRPRDTRANRQHVAWRNDARWKRLSKRLRRLSPFCEFCGATEQLSVDHILSVSDHPELTYSEENCRVLCKSCNGRRGNAFTATEAQQVLTRLERAYERRPTKSAAERVNVAQRAAQTRGETPPDQAFRPGGKARSALHILGGTA